MAKKPQDFVNKEELPSFEEWIEIQALNRVRSPQEELTTLRHLYDQLVGQALATPTFDRMNLFAGLSSQPRFRASALRSESRGRP